ncbi:hypothetical protein [Desulfonema magnum]|nr:hypothetical protein [Desulfonema magnum]
MLLNQAIPNGSGVQKFYFCACENFIFAPAKILFLRLRKSIFRTPERIPENLLTPESTVLRILPKLQSHMHQSEIAGQDFVGFTTRLKQLWSGTRGHLRRACKLLPTNF